MQPILFTVEFRRKMAQLGPHERQEWLASLAARQRDVANATIPSLLGQEIREVARGCRLALVESIERQLGPFDPRHLVAMLEVPRERFVRAGDIERSAEDTPLPLDEEGLSTISAPHAYLLSYRLLALAPGDRLVELGTGSGYGAALAAFIVGSEGVTSSRPRPSGRVLSFEIDSVLAAWAARTLADEPRVEVQCADAMSSPPAWGPANRVVATFAVTKLPGAWVDALPEGGRLVAPVGARDREQRLVLVERREGRVVETEHGAVRYVKNRSPR
jgi:protein-L-isoaspartate(D-aspartate) O-methyltransferase